jgi:hypothetical protein
MPGIKDYLRNTASALAASIHLPRPRETQRQLGITRSAGKPRTEFRWIIATERLGPFFRQIGVKKDGEPIMQGHYIHRFLHATKGWREYLDVPPKMGNAGQPVRYNYPMYHIATKPAKPSRVYKPNGDRERLRRSGLLHELVGA